MVLNSMVPVRACVEKLIGVVNDTVALPDPAAGLTVTQSGALTSQVVFEVTALVVVTTPAVGFHAVTGTVNVGATKPGWLTVNVLVTIGLPTVLVNDTVALRATVVGFGSAVTTTVPFPVPALGAIVNQELVAHVPPTLQDVFEVTATDNVPPAIAGGLQFAVGAMVSVAATPA